MLTTTDVSNKKFEKKMGGYNAIEVNSFLVEISSTISQLNRENAELKRKIDIANKKLTEYETDQSTLSQALLNAHRMAETVIKDAQSKADLTVRYAEIRSEKITEKAKESIVSEQEEFVRLKKEISEFRSSILDTYKKHIELILSIPAQNTEPTKIDIKAEQSSESQSTATENLKDTVDNIATLNDNENSEPIQPETEQDCTQSEQKKEGIFKLNLKFDDETGEYIPADSDNRHYKIQNLKFGAEYDISLDDDDNTESNLFRKKK